MSKAASDFPELAFLDAQIAEIARDAIKKVEATIPLRLHRSHVYARLSHAFMEACQSEAVDTLQALRENRGE